MAWDPAREFEQQHPDVLVEYVDGLPVATGGAVRYRDRHGTVVLIDRRLTGPARRDALAHELVHHQRDGGAAGGEHPRFRPDRIREEQRVARITAERLVPTLDLQRYCDLHADLGHGVCPDDVAREFEVTWPVACDALDNLTRFERGNQ
ncbi:MULTISPECIES: hypothetical protein [unclassified Egicoccus]|uniref:hypothetical protein n=1 Tax=unclassified Egicoccus TaxID=2635606 RepID=UPI00359D9B6D